MTVARRATHQIMMIAAPVPQTINAVISLGTHRPALVESEDAACRIPAHSLHLCTLANRLAQAVEMDGK
jgi:hypothetical protein